jgi:APA family basic amino acid/polyamine antiporter
VLAAEEASRVRGGLLLGGRGGPLDDYVGDVTRYVVGKAPCRVILTAPPSEGREGDGAAPAEAAPAERRAGDGSRGAPASEERGTTPR